MLTIQRAMLETDLTFRTESDGGRRTPPGVLRGLEYRPHIVIGDPTQRTMIVGPDGFVAEEYLYVAFACGNALALGQPLRAELMLMFWPDLDYAKAVPGATFTVREGGTIVAHGRIIRRWTEAWNPAGEQR